MRRDHSGPPPHRRRHLPSGEVVRIPSPKALPPLIESVHLTKSGFEVRFTAALDKASLVPALRSFRYKYHSTYGSPKVDELPLESAWSLSADGKLLTLPLKDIREGFVHEGTVREVYRHWDGVYYSSNLFSMLRREWECLPRRAQRS